MSDNQSLVNKAGWSLDNSYARLPEVFYTRQEPEAVKAPKLVILNERLAASLGLDAEALQGEDAVAVFAGNQVPAGAEPLAQAYAGHQFAYFTMLGDGRAVLLGEQITPSGERMDIQLKGSGRTPYSRNGDGRAALGPMLREYIISEAMAALGIPTTRSLAVVTTGQSVYRETELTGAVLTRVAASHIRVGTFQYAANWGTVEDLRSLADYTLQRHYPEIGAEEPDRYLQLLKAVMQRQAELIAKWLQVGFIHGVMNTDNMTLSGETIDYGPCAFMDVYDPKTVFSSIDRQGRYAYGNQPYIGGWNLARLAESLLPLLHDEEEKAVALAEEAIATYTELAQQYWMNVMRRKLGMFTEEEEDRQLIGDLLRMMQQNKADFTNTFRALTLGKPEDTAMADSLEFKRWIESWKGRLGRQQESWEACQELMRNSNPSVIPRNHRVEEALEAAEAGDYSVMDRLLDVLAKPYAYTADQEAYMTYPDPSSCRYRTYCGT